MFWILLTLIVVGLAMVPVWINSRKQPMTDSARRDWPGKWADLPGGRTRYRWIGGVRGPVIVAVHGLTTPSEVFEQVATELTEIGYRVLVYDLYGRGGSANRRGTQDAAFHLDQLRALLDHLGLDDDLILMGYSMGGAIVTHFAAAEPHRVQRVILLAPAGIDMVETKFDEFCRRWPVLGDWAHTVFGGAMLGRVAAQTAQEGGFGPELAEIQRRSLARRGYLEAVLSSRRGLLAGPSEEAYRGLAASGLPVLAIWGEDDNVIPIRAMGQLAQWHRTAKHETVAGAGHGLCYSHPTEVASHLKSMLLEGR